MLTVMPVGTDIFETGAEVLVNPVNCLGVCGAGLAKEFKERFPASCAWLKALGGKGHIRLGNVYRYEEPPGSVPNAIWHFPTKQHWRDSSEIEDIKEGLDSLVKDTMSIRPASIAIPALGCGLGGLPWDDVLYYTEWYMSHTTKTDIMLIPPLD